VKESHELIKAGRNCLEKRKKHTLRYQIQLRKEIEMKRRKLLVLGSISVMLFLAVWPIRSAMPQQAKVTEMTFNDQMPPNQLMQLTAKWLGDQLYKRTNGRVKITVFPVGTLTAPDKIYDSVVTGMADFGSTSVAYTAGRFPSLDACFIPTGVKNGWVATHMTNDFWYKFRPKDNNDVHMLVLSGCGAYNICTPKKPIYKPEDLKGLKIRASGPQLGAYVRALGATPINMPMSEVFEAAAKGVIDGFLTPIDTQKSWKHAEVTKYITMLPVRVTALTMTFMNLNKWNSMPKDIQDVINKMTSGDRESPGNSELAEVVAKAWWALDIEAENYFKGLGGGRKIIEIPPAEVPNWTKLLNPLAEKYITDYTPKGIPAAEYVKYVQDRARYWNEHVISQQECMNWVKANLEPLASQK
jgi:TRAP-type C4-dicarboxylate transport system substrate-binding protein